MTANTPSAAVLEPAVVAPRAGRLAWAREVASSPALVVAAVLATVVAASAALRILIGLAVPAPGIFGDELIYFELARGLAESGAFEVRDTAFAPWTFGPLYPVLLTPLHMTLGLTEAYEAVKVLNAVSMSLAAVPAYFLARRFLPRGPSLLVAALTVAVPAMAYTTRVMTESLFYPVFLLAVLAVVAATDQLSTRRQALALAAIGVACLARAQAVALLPTFVGAGLLVETVDARRAGRSARAAVAAAARRCSLSLAALSAVVVAAFAYTQAASFDQSHGVLFANARLPEVPRWVLYHLAELDLSLGVVPFAALLALATVAHRVSRRALVLVAVTGGAVWWSVLLASGVAANEGVERIEERFLFYVTPLFLIVLLVWLREGVSRASRSILAAGAAAAVLPALLPLGAVLDYRIAASTTALIPWVPAREAIGVKGVLATIVVLSCLAALAFALLGRVRPGYLVALTVANLIVLSLFSHAVYVSVSRTAADSGIAAAERDWVDAAVGRAGDVTVLWSGAPNDRASWRTVWEAEFFNESARDVVLLGAPMPHLYAPRVHLSGRAIRTEQDASLVAEYVLADSRLGLEGRVVARNLGTRQAIYAVDGPVRLSTEPSAR